MLDFKGKQRKCAYLGKLNGEQFAEQYNEWSQQPRIVPVASTILPIASTGEHGLGGTTGYFYIWLFYEEEPTPNTPVKPKLKLNK